MAAARLGGSAAGVDRRLPQAFHVFAFVELLSSHSPRGVAVSRDASTQATFSVELHPYNNWFTQLVLTATCPADEMHDRACRIVIEFNQTVPKGNRDKPPRTQRDTFVARLMAG